MESTSFGLVCFQGMIASIPFRADVSDPVQSLTFTIKVPSRWMEKEWLDRKEGFQQFLKEMKPESTEAQLIWFSLL